MTVIIGGSGTANGISSFSSPATFGGTLAAQGNFSSASRGISNASVPIGSIIQVQHAYYTSQYSTTVNTLSDVTSLSITPTSSTSKIMVQVNFHCSGNGALYVKRNGSLLFTPSDNYMSYTSATQNSWNSGSIRRPFHILLIDSPSTTSSTTYTVSLTAYTGGAGTGFGINELTSGQNFSNIVLMEIAQ